MLKPRPPFACLRSVTVLCFRRREFLSGKKILDIGHWDGIVRVTGREFRWASWSPLAHLHLLGFQRRLCKPHPASVWSKRLWSISGRHHRYCWSPHCTAGQFQILSVGGKWRQGLRRALAYFTESGNYTHNDHFQVWRRASVAILLPLVNASRLSASPFVLKMSELLTSQKKIDDHLNFLWFFFFFCQITNRQSSSVNVSDKLHFKLGFYAIKKGAMIDS